MRKLPGKLPGRLLGDDKGVAMVLVVALSAIALLLATVALTTSMTASLRSRTDERWVAALPAAQAAAEDYLHRLNLDNNYFTKGNTDPANPAFSRWVNVPGSPTKAQFRYQVLGTSEETLTSGTIRLRASGRVDDKVRTIEVAYRKRGYLDYLYYTDKETVDPALYPEAYGVPADVAQTHCDKYFPGRANTFPGYTSGCRDIRFFGGDLLDGPIGSNDAFLMSGRPTFTDIVTTGWSDPTNISGKRFFRADTNYSVDRPVFRKGAPQVRPPFAFPDGNAKIRNEADPASGGRGCLYTGPTLIRLIPSGKMEVTSPYTKATGSGCGSGFADWVNDATPDPSKAKKAMVDLPPNGVVYVQAIPADPNDPNYDVAGTPGSPCPSAPLLDGKYPDQDEVVYGGGYNCRAGDAWVLGKLRGQLTIASENDVVIVDNLEYDVSRSDNVLGLIATNNVEIYHPVKCTKLSSSDPKTAYCREGTNLSGSKRDIKVEAAILALQHSFTAQNYSLGKELGKLTLHGAVVQRFRGAVATSYKLDEDDEDDEDEDNKVVLTGYAKDYHYDKRLQFLQPPFFLNPLATSWSLRTFSEQKRASYP